MRSSSRRLIKICGLTDPDVAAAAVAAGATHIGIMMTTASARYVGLNKAKAIAAATLSAGGVPVAVFVDHLASDMMTICDACQVITVQLHGEVARAQSVRLPSTMAQIYTVPVTLEGKVYDVIEHEFLHLRPQKDLLLFDHAKGGTGTPFAWDRFVNPWTTRPWRFMLAGGLRPDNVATAIRHCHPDGVDVSSGVESRPGVKDIEQIKAFIARVHAAR